MLTTDWFSRSRRQPYIDSVVMVSKTEPTGRNARPVASPGLHNRVGHRRRLRLAVRHPSGHGAADRVASNRKDTKRHTIDTQTVYRPRAVPSSRTEAVYPR